MTDQPKARDESDWQRAWDARQAALEALLGKADDAILHSWVPIYLGGRADVLTFHDPPGGGVAYVTAGLAHTSHQPPSTIGNYELMVRTRGDEDWAGGLIANLSNYTLKSPLNPNDTIDLGEHQPPGHTVRALLALEGEPPIRFDLLGKRYAVLVLIGITTTELAACRGGRTREVIAALRAGEVLPFTDLKRPPVL